MPISARIERVTHSPRLHVATMAGFVAVNAVGYVVGGGEFVQSWGGSFAAVIATAFLVTKSQGYQAINVVGWFVWVGDERRLRNRADGVVTVDDSSQAEDEIDLSESA
jgi:hypothetical protein